MALTDEEIICTWMRAPSLPGYFGDWWQCKAGVLAAGGPKFEPVELTLDRIWLVQKRLSSEQWVRYRREVCLLVWDRIDGGKGTANLSTSTGEMLEHILNADAPTRIKALAVVLRGEVAGG